MIEPKNINIDGIEFQLNPLPVFTALKLDKKVISLLLPALKDLKAIDSEAEIELGPILNALGESLEKLSDEETERFFLDMFKKIVVIAPGQPPTEMTADVMNDVFQGKLLTIYKLAGEVMKFNKFTPFALLQGGGVMELIGGLKEQTTKPKKRQSLSDRLVTSEEA